LEGVFWGGVGGLGVFLVVVTLGNATGGEPTNLSTPFTRRGKRKNYYSESSGTNGSSEEPTIAVPTNEWTNPHQPGETRRKRSKKRQKGPTRLETEINWQRTA